jgi:hypothetical protein
MKKFILFTAICSFMISCERTPNPGDYSFSATVVGFDLNCSTCILEFPEDQESVAAELGESTNNYYTAVNMFKDDFELGQKIKVNIRKPLSDELRACITLYPTNDYKNVYVLGFEKYNCLTFNEIIKLSYHNCLYDAENQTYLCFDSVLTDSRCPTGVMCFWAGEAKVQFSLQKHNEDPIVFVLSPAGQNSEGVVIDGYRIKMIDLLPYPDIEVQTQPEDYEAVLLVTRETN